LAARSRLAFPLLQASARFRAARELQVADAVDGTDVDTGAVFDVDARARR